MARTMRRSEKPRQQVFEETLPSGSTRPAGKSLTFSAVLQDPATLRALEIDTLIEAVAIVSRVGGSAEGRSGDDWAA
jgi:hypothetical protein